MEREVFPASLYNFLRFANDSSIERKILDCGAGGTFPKIALFHEFGYITYGIEISDDQISKALEYSEKKNINLNIMKGDMRSLPFESNFFGFVYSYNSIFHLSKKDIGITIEEMYRVLKKGGLCYLNLLSIEDSCYGDGQEINPGEFVQDEADTKVLHSFFNDNEPDSYFKKFTIIYKEKKKVFVNNVQYLPCFLEYIVQK
jgi:ubiquinone/menaquinone biosynthesis C-methylase UbiE